jgi:hypothetical protein
VVLAELPCSVWMSPIRCRGSPEQAVGPRRHRMARRRGGWVGAIARANPDRDRPGSLGGGREGVGCQTDETHCGSCRTGQGEDVARTCTAADGPGAQYACVACQQNRLRMR